MEPTQRESPGGKRTSRKKYDPLRRDDFWDCDLPSETSSCKFKIFHPDFGSDLLGFERLCKTGQVLLK